MAGGMVHNTNQSASFIRNPARGASLDVDAVYYNPAGLAFLDDGLYIGLNNQFVTQTRIIESSFPGMNRSSFEGGITAPLFPSLYAAYKTGPFAFSFGFNPIGGGGSAEFDDGLPSFEMQPAMLPGMLSQAGIPTTAYEMDVAFKGESIMYGFQANASYRLNDMLSLSAGIRYISVSNAYAGHLRDIRFNPTFPILGFTGDMVAAPVFFTAMSNLFDGLSGIAGSLEQVVAGGGGTLDLATAQAMGILSADQVQVIAGGFSLIDQTIDPTTLTIAQLQAYYEAATPGFLAQKDAMAANAAMTSDMEVDALQRGTGIAPVFGLNLKLSPALNLAFKYEHKASIKVKNETTKDDVGMFPDGMEVPSDMPSMFALGVSYAPVSAVRLYGTFHYYLDKQANYGKTINDVLVANDEVIDQNFWEAALGVEYALSDQFLLSFGFLRTQTGANDLYQTDLSHSLNTNSLGLGLRYLITPAIGINFGAMNTWYVDHTRSFGAYDVTFKRSATVAALGVDIRL